jgi:hypothetical protein
MRELPAAETDRHLDLKTIFEKLSDVLRFEIEIVSRDFGLHPDLLQLAHSDFFPGFLYLLFLLELKLAVIQQLAYRWNRLRGDFDEVQAQFAGHFYRLGRWNYAFLFTLIIYKPYFTDTDLFVDPQVFVCQLTSFGLTAQSRPVPNV